jgi:hypothetical protein
VQIYKYKELIPKIKIRSKPIPKGIVINLLSYHLRSKRYKTFFKQINLYNSSIASTPPPNYLLMKQIDQYTYNTYDAIGKGYSSQVFKGRN